VSSYSQLGRFSAIITLLPSSMLAGWILGYYVADYFLGSFPWGSIIGTMLGAGLGFFEIFRLLMRRRDDR